MDLVLSALASMIGVSLSPVMWIAVAAVIWRSKSLKTFLETAGICSLALIALLALSGRSMSGPALVAVFAAVFGWGGIGTLARWRLTYEDATGGVVPTRNKLRPAQDAASKGEPK